MTVHLVKRPEFYDVIVAENMFGDIISDLGAATVGGMGIAPSGELGDHHGLFQGAHGSAPDIAGLNVASPLATILSGSFMLRWLGDPVSRQGDPAGFGRSSILHGCDTGHLSKFKLNRSSSRAHSGPVSCGNLAIFPRYLGLPV